MQRNAGDRGLGRRARYVRRSQAANAFRPTTLLALFDPEVISRGLNGLQRVRFSEPSPVALALLQRLSTLGYWPSVGHGNRLWSRAIEIAGAP